MLCKVCGAQIPDDAFECEFCGAKTGIGTETNVVNDATQVVDSEIINDIAGHDSSEKETGAKEIFDDNERRRHKQMEKMLADKKQQLSEIERRRNEKRQKQKRNRIMMIALICALAVAAAGIGIYYVAQNINEQGTIENTPAPSVAALPTPSSLPTEIPSLSPTATAPPYTETEAPTSGTSWSATGNSGTSSSSGSGASSPSSNSGHASGGGTSSGTSSNNTPSRPSGNSGTSSGGSGSQSSSTVSNSGVTSKDIASQLSTGGEVIYNSGTGKYLMTFVSGGTKYYANVSAGSTTEQIKDKKYTITANPTSVTYNGNTVYEITTMTGYEGNDYLLADSGIRLLTENDIKGMSKYDLALARNEIYARHGRKFQTAEYSNYFSSKSWYKINPNYNYSDDNSNLNDIESKNVQFILNAEKR